jgi:hypothetical protein
MVFTILWPLLIAFPFGRVQGTRLSPVLAGGALYWGPGVPAVDFLPKLKVILADICLPRLIGSGLKMVYFHRRGDQFRQPPIAILLKDTAILILILVRLYVPPPPLTRGVYTMATLVVVTRFLRGISFVISELWLAKQVICRSIPQMPPLVH